MFHRNALHGVFESRTNADDRTAFKLPDGSGGWHAPYVCPQWVQLASSSQLWLRLTLSAEGAERFAGDISLYTDALSAAGGAPTDRVLMLWVREVDTTNQRGEPIYELVSDVELRGGVVALTVGRKIARASDDILCAYLSATANADKDALTRQRAPIPY